MTIVKHSDTVQNCILKRSFVRFSAFVAVHCNSFNQLRIEKSKKKKKKQTKVKRPCCRLVRGTQQAEDTLLAANDRKVMFK